MAKERGKPGRKRTVELTTINPVITIDQRTWLREEVERSRPHPMNQSVLVREAIDDLRLKRNKMYKKRGEL